MPVITRKLLRKRAEHNECVISTLEEISLHQEELESINEVLGMTCRKLKILYLQNNIIPKMENLTHLKDLQYLNLALNNIACVEGLQNCEFLKKLDLTLNFIDLDHLKSSIDHLVSRENLQDLFFMGNPAQVNWPSFNSYVIAKLPQLKTLDGTEISRSMQIKARQTLEQMEKELEELAIKTASEKQEKEIEKRLNQTKIDPANSSDNTILKKSNNNDNDNNEDEPENDNENEQTENTPEARVKIYKELAMQKKEKEDREKANAPKERDYEAEHQASLNQIRKIEEEITESEIKQKNEGGWDFYWDEESKPGCVVLEVGVPRFLDTSLIDVDVHPTFISVVIKSKVLRLRLPAEVSVATSKCQRSKTTGNLLVIMPKVDPTENAITIRGNIKARANQSSANDVSFQPNKPVSLIGMGKSHHKTVSSINPVKTVAKKLSLQEQMMLDQTSALSMTPVMTSHLRNNSDVKDDLITHNNNNNNNNNNKNENNNVRLITELD
eukprot:gene4178-5946_t